MKGFLSAAGHARWLGLEDGRGPFLAGLPRGRGLATLWAASLLLLLLLPVPKAGGWKNGELLVWMDGERGRAVQRLGDRFEQELGITVTVEAPEGLTFSFPIAAQAGKGPDVVIWAHDKVAEWAGGGLIAPVSPSPDFMQGFFPQAWQAVAHGAHLWGYPLALETVTLIYNRQLLGAAAPPTQLAQLPGLAQRIRQRHPEVRAVLWDYKSAYYSWGLLASAGAYAFERRGPIMT
jgi:maltose/maltodextrin transport system substrate-binding protein